MQGAKGGKRKAQSEEGEEGAAAGKAAGQSRKVVKRAQGHTPSRKGGGPVSTLRGQSPAAKGPGPSSSTPLRLLNGPRGVQGGLSRLAHSTHAADVENAAKASNGTPAAQVCFRLTATALKASPNSPQSVTQHVVSGLSPRWELAEWGCCSPTFLIRHMSYAFAGKPRPTSVSSVAVKSAFLPLFRTRGCQGMLAASHKLDLR